jgi:hypothetical protein
LSFLPLNLLIEFNMPEGTVLASYLIRPHSPAFTESIKGKALKQGSQRKHAERLWQRH